MKVFTVATQKGGVGKTSTALALASVLQAREKKVLLIDTDLSGNASSVYNARVEGQATLFDVLFGENPKVEPMEAIQHRGEEGLDGNEIYGDIICSDPLLIEAEDKLKSTPDGLYKLQDAIERITGYDYVIIDTGPTLNYMLYNALIAADEIIIPVTADSFGYSGLAQLHSTIQGIQKRQNPKLKIAGLLIVMYNSRTVLGKEVEEILTQTAKKMDTKVFDSRIRVSQRIKESQALHVDIMKYAPSCTSMIDYKSVVDELIGE